MGSWRPSGAQHPLVFPQGQIRRSLLRGRYVYATSFDAAGAFGIVAHHQLVEAPSDFRAGVNL